MKLAKAIRAARKASGMTQAVLAKRVGVRTSTVAGWELGNHGIRLDTLYSVARVLGVDVSRLL